MPYRWDVAAKRYRDTDTGRFLSRDSARTMVDDSLRAGRSATGTLAGLVADGTISAADWRDKMRQEIKEEYIRQYLSAKGGRSQMTPADWGSIGGMLTEQYKYLDGFYADVLSGDMSEAAIAARARMYVNSAREANERAYSRSQGLPDLGRYPGSGSTPCLTNCRCFLEITETEGGWNVYWKLGDSEHCDGCVELAAQWNPLFVPSTARGLEILRRVAPDLNWAHGGSCACGYCAEADRAGVGGRVGDWQKK